MTDAAPKTHQDKVARWLSGRRRGVEIGAFKTPIPGIAPFYVDCFEEYAGERCLLDYKGDACHLPFVDNSLDYVATSHVLEHVANPLAAFHEWGRVLRTGGIIYAVIPDKRFTWDRGRPTTSADHLIADYHNRVTQKDGTHVDDFVDGIAWHEFAPGKTTADRDAYRFVLAESTRIGREINIHFHVFEPAYFPTLLDHVNKSGVLPYQFQLLDLEERFPREVPNGFLAIVRVVKPDIGDYIAGLLNIAHHHLFPDEIVRPGTRRFNRVRT